MGERVAPGSGLRLETEDLDKLKRTGSGGANADGRPEDLETSLWGSAPRGSVAPRNETHDPGFPSCLDYQSLHTPSVELYAGPQSSNP